MRLKATPREPTSVEEIWEGLDAARALPDADEEGCG